MDPRASGHSLVNPWNDQQKIDIIIPVYNAFEVFSECIDSVVRNSANCRLIIIDDCSTDGRIGDLLNNLVVNMIAGIEIVVIKNKINMGFVKSVNIAYKYVENHFVILNSDAEVPTEWLPRLFGPILEDESAASVTPFSNAATICSFPFMCQHSDLYLNLGLKTLDLFCMKYGRGEPIEIPTGVGFCMAFNKKVVEKIGLFDEAFGEGYGEENDWCMRAAKWGYKNLFVSNLFVQHKHSSSFGLQKRNRLLEKNFRILERRHPAYFGKVREFVQRDPIREIRESLAMIIDAQTRGSRKAIMVFDHALGGGANAYSEFLLNKLIQRNYIVIRVAYDLMTKSFAFDYRSPAFTCKFNTNIFGFKQKQLLTEILKIDNVFVNNVVSWPDPLIHASDFSGTKVPYSVFLHDYFTICPSWNLIASDGKFCDLPSESHCERCLKANKKSDHYLIYLDTLADIGTWRQTMSKFLKGAQSLFVFSEASAKFFEKTYGNLDNLFLNEHAILLSEVLQQNSAGAVCERHAKNVAILGDIGYHKGINIVHDLVGSRICKEIGLKLIIFGETSKFRKGYKNRNNNFEVFGRYEPRQLPELLRQHEIGLILIPSIWPETFSFTTSEAILMGYPVVCFDIGAQAERIRKFDCGIVIEDISSDGLSKALRKLLTNQERIDEIAWNTAKYKPVSIEQHFQNILEFVGLESNT